MKNKKLFYGVIVIVVLVAIWFVLFMYSTNIQTVSPVLPDYFGAKLTVNDRSELILSINPPEKIKQKMREGKVTLFLTEGMKFTDKDDQRCSETFDGDTHQIILPVNITNQNKWLVEAYFEAKIDGDTISRSHFLKKGITEEQGLEQKPRQIDEEQMPIRECEARKLVE